MKPAAESEIGRALRRLVTVTGIPLKKLSIGMNISASDCLRWWVIDQPRFKFKQIENLAYYLGISPESILNESYDRVLVRKRVYDEPMSLPARYGENAFSYIRSSAHIVEYVAMIFSRQTADQLLLSMQVPPPYVDNLNNRISLNFFTDLLSAVCKMGVRPDEIGQLSKHLFMSVEHTDLDKMYKKAKTYEECYQTIAATTSKFDENFDYRFSISRSGMSLLCTPSQAFLEANSGKPLQSDLLYDYRKTLFGSMPMLSGLKALNLSVHSCISNGSSGCHYSVNFP